MPEWSELLTMEPIDPKFKAFNWKALFNWKVLKMDGHDLKNIVETLQAAETLATRGIEAEVLDMYSLKPCSQVPSVRWRPA